ncbi:copper amine oxidase N-terminal domain-containing protein [Thermoanaerobacterium thermosaccharolyticum]|uniref:copper amine oxidase N-terminal domain-containing protein n=1 Tax=Thermoanaerobacterium thermosaccharolyticum TaxID=1517 RepID=UPI003D2A0D64
MVKSKWLSFVLVFAMLVSVFVPTGMTKAFASGTSYDSMVVPSISDDTTTELGTFMVDIDPFVRNSEAIFELPDTDYEIHKVKIGDVLFDLSGDQAKYVSGNKGTVTSDVYTGAANSDIKAFQFKITKTSDNGFKLYLDYDGTKTLVDSDENEYGKMGELKFPIELTEVVVPSGASGDIKLTITGSGSGQLKDGSVVVATIGGGDLTVAAVDTKSFSDDGGNVKIRITESAAGKLTSKDTLKLVLPDGFKWGNISDISLVYGTFAEMYKDASGNTAVAASDVNVNTALYRNVTDDTLEIRLNTLTTAGHWYQSTERTAIDITAKIDVDDSTKAKEGDVIAKVRGSYDVTPSEITVGTYGQYDTTISATDSSVVAFSGQYNQDNSSNDINKVSDIQIKESVVGSLVDGRTILLTLPTNARWYKIDDELVGSDTAKGEEVDSDNGVKLIFEGLQGTDNRTAKFVVKGDSTTSKDPAELKIENNYVALEPGVTGDLKVTVGGTAGLSTDSITLAKVVNPVTVTADKTNVKIGVSNQAAGKIDISEYQAGAIYTNHGKNTLDLILPDGVKFTSKPTVKVTSGDLDIDNVNLVSDKSGNDNKILRIEFKSDSTEASTIEVSNIYYDVDRTVGEGDIQVKVGGSALVTVPQDHVYASDSDSDEDKTLDYADIYFSGEDYIVKAANATVVTPAPTATNQTAVFTINSTTYTVNGVQNTLDSAPYVKDGCTYLPARYVAYALGVSSDNVLWDGTKATFILGNKVVQVVPGTTTLIINGATVTMDAPAEIVNGRVMVPFRWIAQAFGAQVQWDATNQTVTMTLQAQ